MNALPRVMLLIDADNVSADVIEQAVQRTLATHGAAHVRRAYCNAETALKQQALFKRLSVRLMVNLSAGKNSTDIAMAVDAMDLVIAERPALVILVSSDSDFAPLVVRLREKGCRVCGIGQRGKTGEETRAAYDEFIDLAHQGPRTPAASPALAASTPDAVPEPPPARKTVARKRTRAAASLSAAAGLSEAQPASRPARKAAAKKSTPATAPAARSASTEAAALARRPAARKATRKTAASSAPAVPVAPAKRGSVASAPAAPSSDTADRILQAVPALRSGSEVALNDIAKALRGAKLLGKHGSSIKLFDKLPSEFAVLQHPDRIRWLGAARV